MDMNDTWVKWLAATEEAVPKGEAYTIQMLQSIQLKFRFRGIQAHN